MSNSVNPAQDPSTFEAYCHACNLVAHPADLVIYVNSLIIVNHHGVDPDSEDRTGWFFVSPTRHVSRFFDLTVHERNEISKFISLLDLILTESLGSKRTMIASLGWETTDHLHFHLVPTITEPITYGYEHFGGGRYIPLGSSPSSVSNIIGSSLRDKLKTL